MISIIVAHGHNRCIGLNGDMPWGTTIKSDLKWFKKQTEGHVILMGRKTYESIGRPLPNRTNVVLTRNKDFKAEGIQTVHSITQFLQVYKDRGECFVIGGAELYKQFIPLANKLYMTQINANFEGDTFFPYFDIAEFDLTYREEKTDVHDLSFLIYERKNMMFK